MINVRISKNTDGDYDIVFENGKIVLAEDGVAAATAMTEKMLTFRDECQISPIVDTVANPQAGVDYYGVIFRADATRAEKEVELQRAALSAPGIERILQWNWEQNRHTVNIDCQVKTTWGDVNVGQEIELL